MLCNDTTVLYVMILLCHVYSKHKLTLTCIALAIFHGYESRQIKYMNLTITHCTVTKDHIATYTILLNQACASFWPSYITMSKTTQFSIATLLSYCFYLHHYHTGFIIEGPNNVTYIPNLTPLPIELTCNVTGIPSWIINGTSFTISELANGVLPGHNTSETNILVYTPVNNTQYVCASVTLNGETRSDPAYIIIAGEYSHNAYTYVCTYITT